MLPKQPIYFALGFMLLLVAGLLFTVHRPLHASVETLVVSPGESTGHVCLHLDHSRIFAYPKLCKLWVLSRHWQHRLQAGEYAITPSDSLNSLLSRIAQGEAIDYQLTVIEGSTAQAFLNQLTANPHLHHTLADHPHWSKELKITGSIEGWFYPSTYRFSSTATDFEVLKLSYEQMLKHQQAAWQHRSTKVPLKDSNELMIVASIIERESGDRQEWPKIAAVIYNRLALNMPLQIDAIVRYGLDQPTGRLLRTALKIPGPYNCYLNRGLPPTPIALPSAEALQAAAHPAQGSWLYFVAQGNGKHCFASHYPAHQRNVEHYYQLRSSAEEAYTCQTE